MVGNHRFCELFLVGIAFLLRDFGGLNFRHIAHGRFLDEVFGLPSADFTPVFTAADCAKEGEAKTVRRENARIAFFIVSSLER